MGKCWTVLWPVPVENIFYKALCYEVVDCVQQTQMAFPKREGGHNPVEGFWTWRSPREQHYISVPLCTATLPEGLCIAVTILTNNTSYFIQSCLQLQSVYLLYIHHTLLTLAFINVQTMVMVSSLWMSLEKQSAYETAEKIHLFIFNVIIQRNWSNLMKWPLTSCSYPPNIYITFPSTHAEWPSRAPGTVPEILGVNHRWVTTGQK